ncbi:MAG: TIGR01777 family protein [Lentisphaeria bacterium]|nr:TIGR01777 family oxidoreductase [Lentisphaeria bacterium]NQZ69218.1 TIGR01777 family protein [Lentisphaeria bacterium]
MTQNSTKKILVIGRTGLIASELLKSLGSEYDIYTLSHSRQSEGKNYYWDPLKKCIEIDAQKFDIICNFSGYNIANKRWSEKIKDLLYRSRIDSTDLLHKHFKEFPPGLYIAASATGIYGNRETSCTETSAPGNGFLAGLCKKWEASSMQFSNSNSRVVILRFGLVLSAHGGALAKMLPPFRFGLGAKLSSGKQHMPWISINDSISIIKFVISNTEISGPVNCVSHSLPNSEFTDVLAKVLKRPALLKMPALILNLIFGKEMTDELLLCSTPCKAEKLSKYGFEFNDTDLPQTLRKLI